LGNVSVLSFWGFYDGRGIVEMFDVVGLKWIVLTLAYVNVIAFERFNPPING